MQNELKRLEELNNEIDKLQSIIDGIRAHIEFIDNMGGEFDQKDAEKIVEIIEGVQ